MLERHSAENCLRAAHEVWFHTAQNFTSSNGTDLKWIYLKVSLRIPRDRSCTRRRVNDQPSDHRQSSDVKDPCRRKSTLARVRRQLGNSNRWCSRRCRLHEIFQMRNQKQCSRPWKILCFHHPIVPPVKHELMCQVKLSQFDRCAGIAQNITSPNISALLFLLWFGHFSALPFSIFRPASKQKRIQVEAFHPRFVALSFE